MRSWLEGPPRRIDDGRVHDRVGIAHDPLEHGADSRIALQDLRRGGRRGGEHPRALVVELPRQQLALFRGGAEGNPRDARQMADRRPGDHQEDDDGQGQASACAKGQAHTRFQAL